MDTYECMHTLSGGKVNFSGDWGIFPKTLAPCKGKPAQVLAVTFGSPVKIKIKYSGGESFHVSRVTNLNVFRTKGGGHNLKYVRLVKKEYETDYGTAKVEAVEQVETKTQDIAEVVIEQYSPEGYKETRTHHFAKVGG